MIDEQYLSRIKQHCATPGLVHSPALSARAGLELVAEIERLKAGNVYLLTQLEICKAENAELRKRYILGKP